MEKLKTCTYCGKELHRKRRGRKLESLRDFNRRQYCGIGCSVKARHKPIHENDRLVKEASKTAKTGTDSERVESLQYLMMVVNDELIDTQTRVNAAKALLPYQARKASEMPGKKETLEAAAKKASAGRFSAGAAPKIVPMVKKEH